jgi:hypothetical protein
MLSASEVYRLAEDTQVHKLLEDLLFRGTGQSMFSYEANDIFVSNKHNAVTWALRLQRVALQGSFSSRALLYFRVKLSTLGPLLQGLGAVI